MFNGRFHKEYDVANHKLLIALAAMSAWGLSMPTFGHSDFFKRYTYYGPYSGAYVGGQFGYANTQYDSSLYDKLEIRHDGIAGRVYLGSQFNPYIGAEFGVAVFSNAEIGNNYGHIKTGQIDLLLRAGIPLYCSHFRFDVKGGVVTGMSIYHPTPDAITAGYTKNSNTYIKPAAGASVSYYVTQNIAVDLSYQHVFGQPNNKDETAPTIDFASFGVSYLFITV